MRKVAALLTCALAIGCDAGSEDAADATADSLASDTPAQMPAPPVGAGVHVDLRGPNGEAVGMAMLSGAGDSVTVQVQLSGVSPGMHGVHFHETGACEGPDFTSAGAHFAPTPMEHGFENPNGPHAGDLPNVSVAADGTVDTTFVAPRVTLREGDMASLLRTGGTALVIHAGPDDYRTDPSGDSGARIACGVIGG